MIFKDLKHPTFEATLPVSGKEVTFRPFTVGEMKTLLIQAADQSEGGMVSATVDTCCSDARSSDLLQADLEYLFLQIRAKSVAESIDLSHECSCGQRNTFSLSFEEDLKVVGKVLNNIVEVKNGVVIEMKKPSTKLLKAMEKERTEETVNAVLMDSVQSLTYGEETVLADNIPQDELLEFINDLIQKDYDKMEDWLLKQPRLYAESKYTCTKCGKDNVVTVTGLLSFF